MNIKFSCYLFASEEGLCSVDLGVLTGNAEIHNVTTCGTHNKDLDLKGKNFKIRPVSSFMVFMLHQCIGVMQTTYNKCKSRVLVQSSQKVFQITGRIHFAGENRRRKFR
jgi:hypothetical protein